MALIGD